MHTSCAQAQEPHSLELVREIRPLPGMLDNVPVFNSNNPEIVRNDGILLSTFPAPWGKAHLDYQFNDRFDVFAHHITDSTASKKRKGNLYLGLLVGNTGKTPVEVEVLAAASHLSRPDAPFIKLPALMPDDDGKIYAGPGDRVTGDLLRGRLGKQWKKTVQLRPDGQVLLERLAIPVSGKTSQLNGRTYMARLRSSGPVRLALVSCFARPKKRMVLAFFFMPLVIPIRRYKAPGKDQFLEILSMGQLVTPRESPPSLPGSSAKVRYGRVSGVSIGASWQARLTDEGLSYLSIPTAEKPVSYVLSSLRGATFGTGQHQSAPLAVRYPDTAYEAHGNYGVKYDLLFPLKNCSHRTLNVALSMETPIISDTQNETVRFADPPFPQIFFRGTIKVSQESYDGQTAVGYFHVVQRRGERGKPLLVLPVPPGETRNIRVEFYYPPDCTPPQLLTITSSLD